VSRPAWELADVVRRFGASLATQRPLQRHVRRTLEDIERCRTAALGGHLDACDTCGSIRISYNSCRNRHCGKCQGVEREAWMVGCEESLLEIPYYHMVFTLPDCLNELCLHNPRTLYNALFDSAWATLRRFSKDERWLGGQSGATMVLHTWGQNLSLHPHVHCIVPGGALSTAGQWIRPKKGGSRERFLFPVKAMSRVFRAVFLRQVLPLLEAGLLVVPHLSEVFTHRNRWRPWRNALYQKKWVVYAKRPFGGPQQVIEYLGRYTHKAAISNHRLLEVSAQGVRFAYKDYRQNGQAKEMTLEGEEFLRRFTLHILPPGFRRMRHYGILSNARKAKALTQARTALGAAQDLSPVKPQNASARRAEAVRRLFKGLDPQQCPVCKTGHFNCVGVIPRQRAPPKGQMPLWIAV
jgi:hypothetical protein